MRGRVAVVTGGSGGIGGAIAAKLAEAGAKVCFTYLHNEQKARALARQLSPTPGNVIAVRADVGSDEDVVALFAEVDRKLGRVSALVNNAGVLAAEGPIDEADADALARLWATNITGYFLCAREAVRRMAPRHGGQGGSIVNISSMAGSRGGSAHRVAYGASKGAVNAFTMGLGKELAADGIRVNVVAPGHVDTEIHRASAERSERLQKAVQSVPMKRAGRPEEVADAVLWLLSDRASFVTSTLVNVAGGA
jgi:NAD(P)-dependent dehydrogenase (short-subunit alcohol dehydrogenase family)